MVCEFPAIQMADSDTPSRGGVPELAKNWAAIVAYIESTLIAELTEIYTATPA